jgi:adenosylcobinamide-GDP ribazoletransferase
MNGAPLPPPVRGLRAAFGFSTRIPVGGFPYGAEDLAWAAAHGPVVGALLGASVGGAFRVLAPVGVHAAALLAIALSLLVTGALHEDGLADTCDALGGGQSPDRVLAILKDSRIGAFGGAALVVSIMGRALLVAELGVRAPLALATAFACARVAPVWQLATEPYVTGEGARSRDLVRGGLPQALVATAWGAVVLVAAVGAGALAPFRAAVLVATLAGITVLTAQRYRARAGGVTGDFLGATEQLGELGALVVLAWRVQ